MAVNETVVAFVRGGTAPGSAGGVGLVTSWATEVEFALPGRRLLFADLVLRDPGAKVPLLLAEVDRGNEGVGTLVEKLTAYRAWCELLAKGAAKAAAETALRRPGARTHDLRLWPTVYPPTGNTTRLITRWCWWCEPATRGPLDTPEPRELPQQTARDFGHTMDT